MCSRSDVEESLALFSKTIQPKQIDDDILEVYYRAFKDIPAKIFREACFQCMDDLQFFPKPKDIKDRLPKKDTHTQEERKRFTCPVCDNYVSFIIEGKCLDCHNGVPVSVGRKPVVQSIDPFQEEKNYLIQSNMMCNQCHAMNVQCIKEPADTGIWKCRQCYTGLNNAQIKDKFAELASIMAGDA